MKNIAKELFKTLAAMLIVAGLVLYWFAWMAQTEFHSYKTKGKETKGSITGKRRIAKRYLVYVSYRNNHGNLRNTDVTVNQYIHNKLQEGDKVKLLIIENRDVLLKMSTEAKNQVFLERYSSAYIFVGLGIILLIISFVLRNKQK